MNKEKLCPYCKNVGVKQPITEKTCYCSNCGSRLKGPCPECGSEQSPAMAKYCESCGYDFFKPLE